ncbi:2-succinyl-6-hydroxy-2,4-cyclohexadiene-1-carboxylate synthase [Ureibacillus chungkukjangi]|uniref:Putative 2-succinyl-6-hydroxy-2,4-cyclohexadiene-1-carboxylate synthase n=1 Tax=Ureibacillus chungkukjangi TaxID=1202712 RepID=A0A318TAG3_9BACL|nr:2-succinyl-6-hydroxy-2,4-cyclohexadiene-1-carboxylate synthase [Ureibacillus chungkukjangi]PYF01951.1 2-succinyl-6-hydroxy-2,4-cyclohexadiene-1-carboxylate synthase [Ureibacillus chungkukjangi]
MKLKVRGVTVNIRIWNEHLEQTIVMLHGFTGSVSTWNTVAQSLSDYRVVAIDLVGHGQTDSPKDIAAYTMDEQLLQLNEIFQQLKLHHFILLGYSMGGRVALAYATAFPREISHLLLESASPGLKSAQERAIRRSSDEGLAAIIEANGLEAFVDKWENIPLFATQKKLSLNAQQAIREERLSQSEIGLANSLRGMGTGAQSSLWSRLEELKMPVTLITGELDEKFCKIAEEMQALLQNAQNVTVKQAGHAIHVENPEQFATIVKDAIKIKES